MANGFNCMEINQHIAEPIKQSSFWRLFSFNDKQGVLIRGCHHYFAKLKRVPYFPYNFKKRTPDFKKYHKLKKSYLTTHLPIVENLYLYDIYVNIIVNII